MVPKSVWGAITASMTLDSPPKSPGELEHKTTGHVQLELMQLLSAPAVYAPYKIKRSPLIAPTGRTVFDRGASPFCRSFIHSMFLWPMPYPIHLLTIALENLQARIKSRSASDLWNEHAAKKFSTTSLKGNLLLARCPYIDAATPRLQKVITVALGNKEDKEPG